MLDRFTQFSQKKNYVLKILFSKKLQSAFWTSTIANSKTPHQPNIRKKDYSVDSAYNHIISILFALFIHATAQPHLPPAGNPTVKIYYKNIFCLMRSFCVILVPHVGSLNFLVFINFSGTWPYKTLSLDLRSAKLGFSHPTITHQISLTKQ